MDKGQVKGMLALIIVTGLILGGYHVYEETNRFGQPGEELKTVTVSGEGYEGNVVLEVTVEGNRIREIEPVEVEDTPQIFETALHEIQQQLEEAESLEDVDLVSGATGSSEGILEALEKALEEAEKENAE